MPPLCYTYIFRPCMDCYDFEAAVAHEIGHILGFHHPDVHPERNWNATVPMSSEICEDSWATAELTGVDLAGSIAADSIMNSLTKQQARACLTLDDLSGLNYMYPTCADQLTRNGQPNCIKSKRNVGALRFAGLVAMPFMAAAALLLVIIIYADRRDAARFKRIQDNLHSVLERYQQRHEEDRSTGARKLGRRGSVASGLGRAGSIMAGFQFGRKEEREEKNAFGSAKHLVHHSEAIDAVLAGNEPVMLHAFDAPRRSGSHRRGVAHVDVAVAAQPVVRDGGAVGADEIGQRAAAPPGGRQGGDDGFGEEPAGVGEGVGKGEAAL